MVKLLDALGNKEFLFSLNVYKIISFEEVNMYIDPNTGGMLFQILAASLALFSGLILLLSGKIRSFFARLRRTLRDASDPKDRDEVKDDLQKNGD